MTSTYRDEDDLAGVRRLVSDEGLRMGRVFRREDLARLGIDDSVIRSMVRRSWWIRLRHGVYADAGTVAACRHGSPERHLLDCAAAICALPLPAYAWGVTAAVVHGLPFDRRLLDDVQLVRHTGTDVRALRRRVRAATGSMGSHIRTHSLGPGSVETRDGMPTVTRSIAAVTCAAQSNQEWAVAVLDAAAWRSPTALGMLDRTAADWPFLRGIGTVRSVLPLVRTGAQTPLESLSRFRFVRMGLPEPHLQYRLHDRSGLIGYADMAWPDWGVIGEADGLAKYARREDLIREKVREDRIRALGFMVVRWTWDDLIHDCPGVVARIRNAALITRAGVG